MNRLRIVLAATVALSTAACSQSTGVDESPTPFAEYAISCGDEAVTELANEPHYSADYLDRWQTSDGCGVSLAYLMTRRGGCFAGVDDILMGWPLGSTHDHHHLRTFVRDPEGKSSPQNSIGFDPQATLPASATDTGLRQKGSELWMEPGSDEFIWVVSDVSTERWPLTRSVVACL